MSKSTPSLLALLGLVAVAGYQNRGKIREMLGDAQHRAPDVRGLSGSSGEGFVSKDTDLVHPGIGGVADGLGELLTRFTASGRGVYVDSWVAAGTNVPVEEHDLEDVLGEESIAELTEKTGLSREELLQRIAAALPDVVNELTPQGRLPTADEAQKFHDDGPVTLPPPPVPS